MASSENTLHVMDFANTAPDGHVFKLEPAQNYALVNHATDNYKVTDLQVEKEGEWIPLRPESYGIESCVDVV